MRFICHVYAGIAVPACSWHGAVVVRFCNVALDIDVGYSFKPIFHDITRPQVRGWSGMDSESVAGILGAVVAAVVLVVAIAYGPIGQFGKPPAKPAVVQPIQPAPAAPRGPVIREVPN